MTRTFLTALLLGWTICAAETDIHWTPNNEIFEMQRQFLRGDKERLIQLDKKSDLIAASPDGRHVLVIRDHLAYDYKDRFMELNRPPEPGKDYSTQVVNCFSLTDGKNGTSIGWKITLPRNAKVRFIRFVDTLCEMEILRTSDRHVLIFRGPTTYIYRLTTLTANADGHKDTELWDILQKHAEQGARANSR